MTYFEMVKTDLMEAIKNGDYNTEDYRGNREGFEEMLQDEAWIDDSITGNASGSYYFNSWEAKEAVLADMETVKEALREFCCDPSEIGERFLNEDWEWLDVTARCYVLGQAVYEVCGELENAGAFDEIEENEDETIFESVVSVVAGAVPSGDAVQNPEVSNA